MRLLLLNPNTSTTVTEIITEVAKAAAMPETEIVSVTAHAGVPYISCRAEAAIAGSIGLEILASRHADFDAAIVAAFGDPGLGAARELFPLPVIGLAESAMLMACMLGRRFGIITLAKDFVPWFEECVAWHGMRERCAGMLWLNEPVGAIDKVQDEKEEQLIELCNRAVSELGADTVILAGSPLAGLAARIGRHVPAPVVDCVAASVKAAESIVALQPRKPDAGSFKRPAPKESTGLSPDLASWLMHRGAAS